MVFISDIIDFDDVFDYYPLLKIPKAMNFNDANFKDKSEELSSYLVKLQDKEKRIKESPSELGLPILSQGGLDNDEVVACMNRLNESFQNETIIPEISKTRIYKKQPATIKFINIGFAYRLPREWFLPTNNFYDLFMFQQFGRNIALGEQRHLLNQITTNQNISIIEDKFSPESILQAIKQIRENGFEPKVIWTPIDSYIKMLKWTGENYVKFSDRTPQPRLNASLLMNGVELKIIHPLGDMPTNTILFSKNSITWHVIEYPEYGALFTVFGNDRLYKKKYVEIIAKTTASCEINPKAVSMLQEYFF